MCTEKNSTHTVEKVSSTTSKEVDETGKAILSTDAYAWYGIWYVLCSTDIFSLLIISFTLLFYSTTRLARFYLYHACSRVHTYCFYICSKNKTKRQHTHTPNPKNRRQCSHATVTNKLLFIRWCYGFHHLYHCVELCVWQCVYVQQHLGTWMCIILCGPFQSVSIVPLSSSAAAAVVFPLGWNRNKYKRVMWQKDILFPCNTR